MIYLGKTRNCYLIAGWWFLATCAFAGAQSTKQHSTASGGPLSTPTYWKQRQFYIPYQVRQPSKIFERIDKVQLLISRTGNKDWVTLEEAKPSVQGFGYHAPEDGQFWFALRHLDRRGRPWPNDNVQPQMRIVIDTQQPELTIEGSQDANGEVVIRYESRDANLHADSLAIEVRSDGEWIPLLPGEPDIKQTNLLIGRVRWRPPGKVETIDIRAFVTDLAGHRTEANDQVSMLSGLPSIRGPELATPFAKRSTSKLIGTRSGNQSQEVANPFHAREVKNPFAVVGKQSKAELPSQDWPTTNQLQTRTHVGIHHSSPPRDNPYAIAARNGEHQAHDQVYVSSKPKSPREGERLQTLQITPLPSNTAPPLMGKSSSPIASIGQSEPQSLWSSPTSRAERVSRVVNSRTFDIEYDLQSVGPWGVSKVEIWGTPDQGQSWRSFGVDPDNRTPVRVTVPDAGTFGFRILVDGANSAGATPPQPGDEPELFVSVDLQPPLAEILDTRIGAGNLSDHLLVTWSASDTNLEKRPIALFYSSYPNGPWSTIASGLENTGSYTWRIERHVPSRFYLRLEVRDIAGNLTTYQMPSPVELARPQPTGRLRAVRPITDD